jgi:transposase
MTAEIVVPDVNMSADEARTRTEKIRETAQAAYDLIIQAYKGGAWAALGYKTWDAYMVSEFSEARMVRLDPFQRQQIVAEMRSEGMSSRAIASGLGVNQATVVRDLRAGDADASPAPVIGTDGKKYKPKASTPKVPDPARKLTEKQAAALAEAEARRAEKKKKSDLSWLRSEVEAVQNIAWIIEGFAGLADGGHVDEYVLDALDAYPADVLAMVTEMQELLVGIEQKSAAIVAAVRLKTGQA